MNIKKSITLLLLLISTFGFSQNPLWMRYPTISPNGEEIAFSYKGDIYTVSTQGGDAQAITHNENFDTHPIWSPDGKQIAFVSDRIGNSKEIFIIPKQGGKAKRLTKYSGTESPYCFTKDGKNIVFKAHIQDPVKSVLFPTRVLSELYQVSLQDGNIEQILAYPAEEVDFHPSQNKFIYQDRKGFENTWRKHHTSSTTRDILEYNVNTGKSTKIVNWKGEDTNPVYARNGKGIYFLSERSGTYNVHYLDFNNPKRVVQKTNFKKHPVRFLSIAKDGTLCFGFDGEIYTLTPNSQKPQKVEIKIMDTTADYDFQKAGFSMLTSVDNSDDGKEIAFTTRGDVFVTATDYSTTKQITQTPAEEQDVTFSPDNRTIAYSSYRDGYWNIYLSKIERDEALNFANSTLIDEQPLIENDNSEKQDPQYSPDGKEIAFVKNRKQLVVYNFENKTVREITYPKYMVECAGSLTYEWSPDGKWFAIQYVANGHSPYYDIGIVSAKGGEDIFNITESGYFCTNPKWVMGGDAIIFSSNRYGMRNHASWGSMRDIMMVFMNKKAYNIYKMNEEEHKLYQEIEKKKDEKKKEEKKDEKEDKKEKKDEKEKVIDIDFENINERIVRLTPYSGRIEDAYVTKDGKKLYYMAAYEANYDLWVKDLRKGSNKLLKKLNSWYSFANDKEEKTLFLFSGRSLQKMILAGESLKPINYNGKVRISPAKEREAMFNYMYREEKERFYKKDMHGVDWDKLTKHYRKFLPHINNNYDFAEMLSELLGELNVSHTGSGYRPSQTNDRTAELGLFVSFTEQGVKVDEIVHNTPFDKFNSKLKVGDFIEKIDGVEVKNMVQYYNLLNDKINKNTLVTIHSANEEERWEEVVKPISQEFFNELLYRRWVKQREKEVEKLSNGKLGYVHIRSMGDASFRDVYSKAMGKYYKKEGMVIDIRYNGGGRLHEDVEVFFSGKQYLMQEIRGNDYCEMPSRRWNKPSVMLITQADYSNAHGTPWVYKKMGIGKLVGMPVPGTMTSVNWVPLQNRSLYFGIPVIGYRTAEGTYLENDQLEPDVKTELDLDRAIQGNDSQLERAVKELLKELK